MQCSGEHYGARGHREHGEHERAKPNGFFADSRRLQHVIVPGGQRFYINALGALAYTRAHSGIIPENSIVGEIQAFQEGGFIYAAGGGWYACPASEPGVYQIFNRLEGVVLDAACIGINIAVNSLEGGLFAWQYQ